MMTGWKLKGANSNPAAIIFFSSQQPEIDNTARWNVQPRSAWVTPECLQTCVSVWCLDTAPPPHSHSLLCVLKDAWHAAKWCCRVALMRQNARKINCLPTTCVYRPRSIKLNSCSIYFVYLFEFVCVCVRVCFATVGFLFLPSVGLSPVNSVSV